MKSSVDQVFLNKLSQGDLGTLSRAITIVESETLTDQIMARDLMDKVFHGSKKESLRIGISGAPGAGKSTFINQLGMSFIRENMKVAVLAIDPSSEISRGSILGDKTRMEELSRERNSYIRPSSSRGFLGGVHPATRDTIRLCEYAGYDVIIVETVGVGQSESTVADLVDFFWLLAIPGAGDELQGIKRGILERIDGVIINKADASQKTMAQVAAKQYEAALTILRGSKLPVFLVSSIEKIGIEHVCEELKTIWSKDRMRLQKKREEQNVYWLKKYLQFAVESLLQQKLQHSTIYGEMQVKVRDGHLDVRQAAQTLMDSILHFKI